MSNTDLIAKDEVRRVAHLARLTLSDDEAASLTHDMQDILAYIAKLQQLDTQEVAPTSHAVELPTKLRVDAPADGLALDQALGQAPEPIANGFGVPKIIE